MSGPRILCLGAGEGWHAAQLREAARACGSELSLATYESLRVRLSPEQCRLECEAGELQRFDVILTRTMPAGSLEQISFRLAMLHTIADAGPSGPAIVNPPRSLEIAIDKFATLARVRQLGYPVPDTIVAQSRGEAVEAFAQLGGDCVVKPIFGGEGRGVMRIRDPELAWYTFSTLQQLGAVFYVQRFVPPGGRDTRLLVIGDEVLAVRRRSDHDFRTNVSAGAGCQAAEASADQINMARRICDSIGLKFASVDVVDSDDGEPKVIEVNGIPGWKGAQSVIPFSIADRIIAMLATQVMPSSIETRY
jgi:ribosomal protein S6--L-glutamate ligase